MKLTPVDYDPFAAPAESAAPVAQAAPQPKLTPVSGDPFKPKKDMGTRVNEMLTRGAYKALSGMLGMPVDAIENVLNLGLAAYGTAATAAGRPDMAPMPISGSFGGSQSIERGLTEAGAPTDLPPDATTGERLLYGVGKGAVYGVAPASSVPQVVANTGMGLAQGVGGAVAQEIAPNNPYAEAIGTMVPGAGAVLAAAAAKGGVRGMSGKGMQNTIDDAQQAGVKLTAGQASGNRAVQAVESGLSKVPGGAGQMARMAASQLDDAGARMAQTADNITTNRGAEQSGRTIESGIKGFAERFNVRADQLDADVAAQIPQQSKFPVTNTLQKVGDLTRPIPDAPAMSALLADKVLNRPEVKAFMADAAANGGAMPYESLRQIRTIIGQEMRSTDIIGTPAQGRLKALYGALSNDMATAAKQTGPKAEKAWNRFNSYYSAGRDRIDYLQGAIRDAGEATYKSAMTGSNDGATKLRALKRSLKPGEFKQVVATTIEKLGKATPGNQNADGDAFSFNTFLTNYNRLPASTRDTLFSSKQSFYLEKLAKTAERIKASGGVFSNSSGTTQAAVNVGTQVGIGGLILGQLLSGNVAGAATTAATTAGVIGGANAMSRALTRPEIVEWLAQGMKISGPRAQQHLARLTALSKEIEDPDERGAVDEIARLAAGYEQVQAVENKTGQRNEK